MRDYGVVRVRFWAWAKRKKLSAEARGMALYLLTCSHGNSLGCFRLPMAYLCDDLDTTSKAAAKTLEELQALGFLERDEEEGWTWLCDYLEHNPVPNQNVGKAIGKMLEQVPHALAFYPDLLANLNRVSHFPDNLIDTLRERYLNGSDTVSRAVETHTQTHTHEHIQEHEHTTAADAPDVDAAFAEFLKAAKTNGWVEAKSLDPDRRRKLAARIAEHKLVGWMEMLERAGKSEFLRTNFRLKLDWVLEPKNFRKVIEGNYDNKAQAPPKLQTIVEPSSADWKGRVDWYREKGMWNPLWGPNPDEPGCFAPREFLQ